jgi:hypothetical protein
MRTLIRAFLYAFAALALGVVFIEVLAMQETEQMAIEAQR